MSIANMSGQAIANSVQTTNAANQLVPVALGAGQMLACAPSGAIEAQLVPISGSQGVGFPNDWMTSPLSALTLVNSAFTSYTSPVIGDMTLVWSGSYTPAMPNEQIIIFCCPAFTSSNTVMQPQFALFINGTYISSVVHSTPSNLASANLTMWFPYTCPNSTATLQIQVGASYNNGAMTPAAFDVIANTGNYTVPPFTDIMNVFGGVLGAFDLDAPSSSVNQASAWGMTVAYKTIDADIPVTTTGTHPTVVIPYTAKYAGSTILVIPSLQLSQTTDSRIYGAVTITASQGTPVFSGPPFMSTYSTTPTNYLNTHALSSIFVGQPQGVSVNYTVTFSAPPITTGTTNGYNVLSSSASSVTGGGTPSSIFFIEIAPNSVAGALQSVYALSNTSTPITGQYSTSAPTTANTTLLSTITVTPKSSSSKFMLISAVMLTGSNVGIGNDLIIFEGSNPLVENYNSAGSPTTTAAYGQSIFGVAPSGTAGTPITFTLRGRCSSPSGSTVAQSAIVVIEIVGNNILASTGGLTGVAVAPSSFGSATTSGGISTITLNQATSTAGGIVATSNAITQGQIPVGNSTGGITAAYPSISSAATITASETLPAIPGNYFVLTNATTAVVITMPATSAITDGWIYTVSFNSGSVATPLQASIVANTGQSLFNSGTTGTTSTLLSAAGSMTLQWNASTSGWMVIGVYGSW